MKKFSSSDGGIGRSGFSLIEAVVAVAIFSVLIVAVANLYNGYHRLYALAGTQIALTQQSNHIMDELLYYSTQADRVLTAQTVNGRSLVSGESSLVLELPSVDEDGEIIDEAFDYAAFYIDGPGRLFIAVQPSASSARDNTTKPMGDSVVSLVFSYDDLNLDNAHKISVDLITQRQVAEQAVSNHTWSQITLRNH